MERRPFQLQLRRLTREDQVAFDRSNIRLIDQNPVFQDYTGFPSFLARLERQRKNEDPATLGVAMHQLFGFVEDEVIGRLSFRPQLNEHFQEYAGHVGYFVLPPHRSRGYATEMLRQGLNLAKDSTLSRVLVTCRNDNQPSIRTIEKCGGQLERTTLEPEDGISLRRYWIELNHAG